PYYEQASLVIAHGGLAVTMEVLSRGLPLVRVSNADRYDGHQEDILRAMAAEGYLCWCKHLNELGATTDEVQSRSLRRYTSPECNIHQVIEAYLAPLKS